MRRWIILLAALMSLAASANNSRQWKIPVIFDAPGGITRVVQKTLTLPKADGMPLVCKATPFRYGKIEYYCIMSLKGGIIQYKKYMITEVKT